MENKLKGLYSEMELVKGMISVNRYAQSGIIKNSIDSAENIRKVLKELITEEVGLQKKMELLEIEIKYAEIDCNARVQNKIDSVFIDKYEEYQRGLPGISIVSVHRYEMLKHMINEYSKIISPCLKEILLNRTLGEEKISDAEVEECQVHENEAFKYMQVPVKLTKVMRPTDISCIVSQGILSQKCSGKPASADNLKYTLQRKNINVSDEDMEEVLKALLAMIGITIDKK